ncbi:MAG TPA: hypothetical protein VFR90_02975 [Methylibium sp.]|uniref:hypothetical protein n=1 Tax=Methylibium sp. TaxID=2067992 RepID=UPI002DBBBD46|nr:hypothetical protein [Methylibium sp.]HEU4458065.1 hypothetical protein [Methylibium sp.]
MPMTTLFVGAILVALFHEIEQLQKQTQKVRFSQIIKATHTRSSFAILAFLALTAALAAAEIYLYGQGEIYTAGTGWAWIIKLVILTVGITCLFFVRQRNSDHLEKNPKVYRATIILGLVLVFALTFI